MFHSSAPNQTYEQEVLGHLIFERGRILELHGLEFPIDTVRAAFERALKPIDSLSAKILYDNISNRSFDDLIAEFDKLINQFVLLTQPVYVVPPTGFGYQGPRFQYGSSRVHGHRHAHVNIARPSAVPDHRRESDRLDEEREHAHWYCHR